jgi:prepilin-type N-terminal cleavage/methylation domain-containing protein
MNTNRSSSMVHRSAGFSLVEVLIAIFVLAIGLLGVAAVFPAVVRQQRNATDAVQGISIQRSVEELLRGNSELSEANVTTSDAEGNQLLSPRGWALIAGDANFSRGGDWAPANEVSGAAPSASGITLDTRSGDMYVGSNAAFGSIRIPLSERLIPRPSAGSAVEPRFVWDFVARRVAAGEKPVVRDNGTPNNFSKYDDDTLQLAVFVRRIDSGIRTPGGRSLGDVLTADNRSLVPVAEDRDGRPTFDGFGRGNEPRYSPIRTTTVSTVIDSASQRPTLSVVTASQAAAFSALRPHFEQLGQKFVDARGMVHEVVRVNRDVTPVQLTIDPPLASGLVIDGQGAIMAPEVYFTSQVPASVSVVTIRR